MSQAHAVSILSSELYVNTSVSNKKIVAKDEARSEEIKSLRNNLFTHILSFHYNRKTTITFSLSSDALQHYILIKGLLEFCRNKQVSLTFNSQEKTIKADLDVSNVDLLETLFAEVEQRLVHEIRFKEHLKRMIAFEARYKAEALTVYTFANAF